MGNMKIFITESQLKHIIQSDLGEDYPQSWNIEDFKKLKSFNARIRYCEQHLQRISSGSSRIAYKIDDTKVLKLAKNKKGLAQNIVEISHSKDYMLENIVANIFDYDENNLWVEMELAQKLTKSRFASIVGVSFEDFSDAVFYYYNDLNSSKSFKPSKPENMDEMWENDFIREIFELIGSYDMPYGDLIKLNTYGVVKRNNQDTIVMVDYGVNKEVIDKYYSKN